MSLMSLNTTDVLACDINMPLNGVWTADIILNQPNSDQFEIGALVNLQVRQPNGLSLLSTVIPRRNGSFIDAVHVRVCGGNGGMSKTATPRQFTNCTVKTVLDSLVDDGGENLSDTISPSILNQSLSAWTIKAEPICKELIALIDQVFSNVDWRFLPDGSLWLGSEEWASITQDGYQFLLKDPKSGHYTLGTDVPYLLPGYNLSGIGNIVRVVHSIDSDRIRSDVYVPVEVTQRGFKESVIDIVSTAFNFNYYAQYVCTVVSQVDNAVDIQPNDKSLPGLQKIPLTTGSFQLVTGQHVMLFWDGANQQKPACYPLWGSTDAKFVALDGDQSDCGSLTYSGSGSLSYSPPGSPTPGTIALKGIISSSATKIKGI